MHGRHGEEARTLQDGQEERRDAPVNLEIHDVVEDGGEVGNGVTARLCRCNIKHVVRCVVLAVWRALWERG